jgi:hypothetical protein
LIHARCLLVLVLLPALCQAAAPPGLRLLYTSGVSAEIDPCG